MLALSPGPSRSLTVSVLTSVIVPRDGISNICLQQIDDFTRYAREQGLCLKLKVYAGASDVQDSRIVIAPDLAGVVTDEHFLHSDVILYHFGIVYPLFDSIHLAPPTAKVVVYYYGITSPMLFPKEQRGVIEQSYRQLTNVLAADQVLTYSGFLVDELVRIGVASEIISKVPPSTTFCDGAPMPVRTASATLRLAYVGRFVPAKGVADFLQAAVDLARADQQPFIVDLVGSRRYSDQAYIQRLEEMVREAGLEDRIHFHYDVSDAELRGYLQQADALIIPSYHEGFCIPVIDAMACGCFVICSDAGALPETSGGLGLVYPVGDRAALRRGLEEFAAGWRHGRMPAQSGPLPMADWRASAARYVAGFTHQHSMERLCAALFGERSTPDSVARNSLLNARRAVLTNLHQGSIQVPANRILESRVAEALAADTSGHGPAEPVVGPAPAAAVALAAADVSPPAAPAPADPPPAIDYAAALDELWRQPDEQFVVGLYGLLLNRPADVAGALAHLARLQQGTSRADLLKRFADSPEAQARGLDTSWLPAFQRRVGPVSGASAPAAVPSTPLPPPVPVRFRERIGVVPGLGKAVRYCRRVLYLPWNFQKLYDAILPSLARQQGALEQIRQEAQHRRDEIQALHAAVVAAISQSQSALQAELNDLRARHLQEQTDRRDRFQWEVEQFRAQSANLTAALQRQEAQIASTSADQGKHLERLAAAVGKVAAALYCQETQLGATHADQGKRWEQLAAEVGQVPAALQRQETQLGAMLAQQEKGIQAVAAAQTGMNNWLQLIASEQGGLNKWLNLLTRKEEIMAMDLRERIRPVPDSERPEPVVVNPALYQRKLAAAAGTIRVNLGCGEKPLPDYINVDFRPMTEVDIVADIRQLPFAPGSLAEIASSHLVEHFRQYHMATVILPYWKSLLKPGGTVRIICPNWQAMQQRLQAGQMSFAEFKYVTFGRQDYSGDDHFTMYWPESLARILTEAGFHDVQIVTASRLNDICPEMEVTATA